MERLDNYELEQVVGGSRRLKRSKFQNLDCSNFTNQNESLLLNNVTNQIENVVAIDDLIISPFLTQLNDNGTFVSFQDVMRLSDNETSINQRGIPQFSKSESYTIKQGVKIDSFLKFTVDSVTIQKPKARRGADFSLFFDSFE